MANSDLLTGIKDPSDLKRLERDQLAQLAGEIRQRICDQVSHSGGHFAPNLGVVELTIALHYVFDFSYDRLLFDVGHQCYPHKLLTGRQHLFSGLRQRKGMSGFPEPRESEMDLFSVGHAGTSISTGIGLARGDELQGEADRSVVAMVGDASIVNGVAMEGLNNAGTLKRQFLVVLNDNGMSIAKPQGALSSSFDRIRLHPAFGQINETARKVIQRLPGSETFEELYGRASVALKALTHHNHFFSQFGLLCIGPTDGHDLGALIDVFQEIRQYDRPVLLHCKTIKGKGFEFATGDPTTFHSPKPFTISGNSARLKKGGRSFTTAFAENLIEVMEKDEKIFAVTAAMPDGTGINKVLERFPKRSLDTGICESHAMDMCAGMAKSGLKPFFAVYSTFAQRALDQVFQEVALQGLPVRVCMDRAGFVGGDGAVHHGFMDIALFRSFPGATLLAASDEQNLRASLEFMRGHDAGATFLRYPRDSVATKPLQKTVPPYQLGKANLLQAARGKTPQMAILAYGTLVYQAAEAVSRLAEEGFDVALYDARFAKPVDLDLLRRLDAEHVPVLTVEDHLTAGGFGSCVLEACNEEGLSTRIFRLGMPQKWIYQDSRENQLKEVGLDADGIAGRAAAIFKELSVAPRPAGRGTVQSVAATGTGSRA